MMLYVHLFSSSENVELCTYFLNYGSVPLVQKLTRCTAPVPFFLIVSGYGFYKQLYKPSSKSNWQRIWSLYKPYWIINGILCACAIAFLSTRIDLSPKALLYNVSGLDTSYNPHCWFVLPYVLLAIGARKICGLVERCKAWLIFSVGVVVHLISYAVLDWYDTFLNGHRLIMLAVNYCYLLPPSYLGHCWANTIGRMSVC